MVAKPRFLHTTVASVASHMLSHTVPHCVNIQISTLPSYCVEPPTNLICPLKLHCPPEIIGQVAYAHKFENSYTVYSIKIHCPWFLLAKCTTAWQDSHTSKGWHKKSRFILQIRRCTIKKTPPWSSFCVNYPIVGGAADVPKHKWILAHFLFWSHSSGFQRAEAVDLWNEANPKLETWERGHLSRTTIFKIITHFFIIIILFIFMLKQMMKMRPQ